MKRYPIGFAYKVGETTMCAGPTDAQITTLTNHPTTPSFLYLGSRSSSQSESMKAWYSSLTIIPSYATPAQMGAYMFNSGDLGMIVGGQSNGAYYARDQATAVVNNNGEMSFTAAMDSYWTTTRHWMVQGATGGTALLKINDTGAGWWYDPATGTFGPAYASCLTAAQAFIAAGGTIGAIVWDQGENDSSNVATAGGGAQNNGPQYQSSVLLVFSAMRSVVSNVPIVIIPIGRRQTNFTPNNGYEIIREIQYAIAAANPSYIFMAPEKYNQPLEASGGNTVHLAAITSPPGGYPGQGPIVAKKLRGVLVGDVTGTDGPRILTASRSSTTVTAIASENLSPASAAQGLTFFDGTTKILFSSVTVSGSTITGTLASSPAGTNVETLYMGYNDLPDVTDYTKILSSTATGLAVCGGTPMVLPFNPGSTLTTWGDGSQSTWGNGQNIEWSA